MCEFECVCVSMIAYLCVHRCVCVRASAGERAWTCVRACEVRFAPVVVRFCASLRWRSGEDAAMEAFLVHRRGCATYIDSIFYGPMKSPPFWKV